MNGSFLPPNYEVPKTGGSYTKFQPGDNKFRILSAPVMGFEYWNTEGKPVRLHNYPDVKPANMRNGETIKHFWALKVWNYRTEALEVLEIVQSTIQSAILALSSSADWGDPREYDITINKSGSGKENTKYAIMPSPMKPAATHILEALAADENSLDDLFEADADAEIDLGEVGVPLAEKDAIILQEQKKMIILKLNAKVVNPMTTKAEFGAACLAWTGLELTDANVPQIIAKLI